MKHHAMILLTGFVLLTACADQPLPAPDGDPPLIGVKIYEHEGDPGSLFERWAELGINTAFVSQELAARPDFRASAERTGTDVFVIFPVFFAPDALAADPELHAVTATGERAREDWVDFACPSREAFRRKRVDEAVATVEQLRPAGLSIDFIRHFVFWEMVGPERAPETLPDTCYCSTCLKKFADTFEVAADLPVDDPAAAASWIRDNAAEQWVRFKCRTITSMVDEIVSAVREVQPGIRITLHAVPWRSDDFEWAATRIAGQDLQALGEIVDYVSPMCYTFMQYRPPGWITSVVQDMDRQAGCPVLPSIQVGVAYREGEVFDAVDFEACVRAALEPPSAGVVFWSWDAIAAEPEKADVIRRVLGG